MNMYKIYFGMFWMIANCGFTYAPNGGRVLSDASWISSPSLKRGLPRTTSHPNVELLIVLDTSMVNYHGGNDATKYSLTIMNMVSKMYRSQSLGFPVNIVVVKVLMADQVLSDSFIVAHDAKTTLKSFCSWQKRQNPMGDQDPFHHDHAILLTRHDICASGNLPCSTVGMSMFGGMCNVGYSCSIVQDTGLNTAFTVTQMIGNSLGIQFDENTECKDTQFSYIMSRKRNTPQDSNKLQWSPCSRQALEHFLSTPVSRCLSDPPLTKDLDEGRKFIKLPGEMFDLDKQCQLNFGKEATFCRIMYGFACRMLWCHIKKGPGGCTTTRWGAADGTQCGKNKWCMNGHCVPVAKLEPVDGNWGNWKEWNGCSRTCGGGIQKSYRNCDTPRQAHGGNYCKGEGSRIRICNTKKCLENTPNHRDAQCSKYDKTLYNGRQYKWKGFYFQGKECSLTCKADGMKFFRTMSVLAADGTPCRPGSYDRCVGGTCLAFGCDYKRGSNAEEDSCGVCLGNGSTCTMVEEVYKDKLGIGYQTFVTIPRGSTNIAIREKKASRNYLAIFDVNDKGILNGKYRIERPGVYHRVGTILQYKRRGNLEGIWMKGPITRSLKIAILFQTNNSGIWYRYYKQKKILTNRVRVLEKPSGIFLWRQGYDGINPKWTKCSITCGKGHQMAVFDCVDAIRDHTVNDLFCSLRIKPELVQECQERECPIPNAPVEWKRSGWGHCSRSCGTGYQRRSVFCVRTDNKSLVSYRLCKTKKPRTVQACNVHDCFYGNWKTGPWSQCSQRCGKGIQQRNVTCLGKNGQLIHSSLCAQTLKPQSETTCDGYCTRWVTGKWNKCSSCNEQQSRCVICIHMTTFEPSSLCEQATRPPDKRPCEKSLCKAVDPPL